MNPDILNITSGDACGSILEQCGIPGEVFVWHDILYDGPRIPGWPDQPTLEARARFLENETGQGMTFDYILDTLHEQYSRISKASDYKKIILWFDACLFDQSMLVHILTCLAHCNILKPSLICLDAFPGIVPFNGLGQLSPDQMASVYDQQTTVTAEQLQYAQQVDTAFALQDRTAFESISSLPSAPLPWVPRAVKRWIEEQPDPDTGLGKLETLALAAIKNGSNTPKDIFSTVARADTPPQYWGDTMLWAKINRLADKVPPLVTITGPLPRLPQFTSDIDLNRFTISPAYFY